MKHFAITNMLEQSLFEGVFGYRGKEIMAQNPKYLPEDVRRYPARCLNGMFSGIEDGFTQRTYPFLLMRADDLTGYFCPDVQQQERAFEFNDLPMCREFSLFLLCYMPEIDEGNRWLTIYSLAPACRDEQPLNEFLNILQKYQNIPAQGVVKRAQQLAIYLHRNFVSWNDFEQKSELHRYTCSERIDFICEDKNESYPNSFERLFFL